VIWLDVEIKDMILKLLEGQTRINDKISELKAEVKRNSVKLESLVNNTLKAVSKDTKDKELNKF